MEKFDVSFPEFGKGIVKKKWTDLRDLSDNETSPIFRPWLISKKPDKDVELYGDVYGEYFKSKEECEKIIDRYKKIQQAIAASENKSRVDRLC